MPFLFLSWYASPPRALFVYGGVCVWVGEEEQETTVQYIGYNGVAYTECPLSEIIGLSMAMAQ